MENALGLADVDELRAALARGETLPAGWYADPAILRLEQERIFARSWQYAGRAEQVAEPGDYFACVAGHVPVVVVRGCEIEKEEGSVKDLLRPEAEDLFR